VGTMRIGLYSEAARRAVVEARALIAARGYRPMAADIRAFRQDIMRDDDERWRHIVAYRDFYSISGCRDLLFNVMEHRFTIPQIKALLDANGLWFRGFELKPEIVAAFCTRFGNGSLLDLDRWHAFESDNPQTFRNMYLFTAGKAQVRLKDRNTGAL
jgi:hypothetical protein